MAEPTPHENLVRGRGVSAYGDNSLLGSSHAGFLSAVYVHVDLSAPSALVVRESDKGAVLELRNVAVSDSLLFGGTAAIVGRIIPQELATNFTKAIDRMVRAALEPEDTPSPRREGSTLEFLSFSSGCSATTRAPSPVSQPGKLVHLATLLQGLVQTTDETSKELQEQASELAKELAEE